MKIPTLTAILTLAMFFQPRAIAKNDLVSKYKNKFVVVLDVGLSTGFCTTEPKPIFGVGDNPLVSVIVFGLGDVKARASLAFPCDIEPTQKGEVLRISRVDVRSGALYLNVQNISPHSVTRGIGGFAHQTAEIGKAEIIFRSGAKGKDLDAAAVLADHWLNAFDSAVDAAKFGNTASGVFVNQLKASMSCAEVEAALGVPLTRVDLGEKVLYKYKDLSWSFVKVGSRTSGDGTVRQPKVVNH